MFRLLSTSDFRSFPPNSVTLPKYYRIHPFVLGKLSNRKSNETWELVQLRGGGGVVEKSNKPQVSVGNSSKLGGGLQKSKKSQVPEGIKDWKIMTRFHIMRTQKHKMLSIIILNMAKCTISLWTVFKVSPLSSLESFPTLQYNGIFGNF